MKKGMLYGLFFVSTGAFAGGMGDVTTTMLADGFYAGLGIGATSLSYKTSVVGIAPQSEHFGHSGVLGDVFLGYNRDFAHWFNLGLEGFYSYYALSNTLTAGNAVVSSEYNANYNYGLKVMPAVNVAGNVRVFGEVGAVSGHFKYRPSSIAQQFGSPSSYSKNLAALLLGVGTDIALSSRVSVRGEYQNIAYNDWNISTPLTTGSVVKTKFQNRSNQFIASIIYHFS